MFVYRDEKGRITDVCGSIDVEELERLKAEYGVVAPGKAVGVVTVEGAGVEVPETEPEPEPELESEPEPEPEPEPEEEPEPEPEETLELPKAADNKATWVDFAVTQGVDRGEAEALTKQELVDIFSKEG